MSSSLSGLGTRNRRRSGLPILPILSSAMLLVALALLVLELVNFSRLQQRLPADLTVAGVDVGNMLPGEAVATWERAYAQPVLLYYGNAPILLDPSTVGFRINNQVMLAEATASNDLGGGFWGRFINYLSQVESIAQADVSLNAEYQRNLLNNYLQDISVRYDRRAGGASFDVNTLGVSGGQGGESLDVQRALPLVEAALFEPENRTVVLPIAGTTAFNADISTLENLIIAYLDANGFIYDGQTTVASVYILDLQTGQEINLNGDVAFSAASVMKLPIMMEYYRELVFAPSQEEAWLMANSMLCSNNSSSNLLMQIIGDGNLFTGLQEINDTMQLVGARNTFITAPFDLGIAGQELGSIAQPATDPNPNFDTQPDPFNQTTAEDMGTLLTMIYDCEQYGSGLIAADPEGYTQAECRQMMELMSGNDLLRLLQGGIPPGVRISHKNGWIFDTVGDVGVVFAPNGRDYVISVFLWEETEFQDFERLWPLVEGISRATWNYFVPEAALPEPRLDLPFSAQECEGNYLPPDMASTDLNDIDAWRDATG